MSEVADRIHNDTIPSLKTSIKEETQEAIKKEKQSHVQACTSFLELYQTYTIQEYDYWEYKNAPMFSLFIDKFSSQAEQLEKKSSELILGVFKTEGKFDHLS